MLPWPAHVRSKGEAALSPFSTASPASTRPPGAHPHFRMQILKAEFWQKGVNKSGVVGPHYFVHYKGWKQTCVAGSSLAGVAARSSRSCPAPALARGTPR